VGRPGAGAWIGLCGRASRHRVWVICPLGGSRFGPLREPGRADQARWPERSGDSVGGVVPLCRSGGPSQVTGRGHFSKLLRVEGDHDAKDRKAPVCRCQTLRTVGRLPIPIHSRGRSSGIPSAPAFAASPEGTSGGPIATAMPIMQRAVSRRLREGDRLGMTRRPRDSDCGEQTSEGSVNSWDKRGRRLRCGARQRPTLSVSFPCEGV
jgi:hypothetical protein